MLLVEDAPADEGRGILSLECFRERVRVAGGEGITGEATEVVGDDLLEPGRLVPLLVLFLVYYGTEMKGAYLRGADCSDPVRSTRVVGKRVGCG